MKTVAITLNTLNERLHEELNKALNKGPLSRETVAHVNQISESVQEIMAECRQLTSQIDSMLLSW